MAQPAWHPPATMGFRARPFQSERLASSLVMCLTMVKDGSVGSAMNTN